MTEIFNIDVDNDIPGIFTLEKTPLSAFTAYKLQDYNNMTLDTLLDFETSIHLQSAPRYHRHTTTDAITSATLTAMTADGNTTRLEGRRYVLVYQYYDTSPMHDILLRTMTTMDGVGMYSTYVKFVYVSLARGGGVCGYANDEMLVFIDLELNSTSNMQITPDLDGYEIDQWLRMHVYEIMFEDNVDL